MKASQLGALVAALSLVAGCSIHREVQLHETNTTWHYPIETTRYDAGLVLVVDAATLERVTPIRSALAGTANVWDARPGRMLKQVADVELPQMVAHYVSAGSYQEPDRGSPRVTLVLDVVDYDFADLHASLTVHGTGYGPDRRILFERNYDGKGSGQGGKMFWGGAFAMKSAIRQSTLEAYQQVLAGIRADLDSTFRSAQVAGQP
jgi:hypothetical protein